MWCEIQWLFFYLCQTIFQNLQNEIIVENLLLNNRKLRTDMVLKAYNVLNGLDDKMILEVLQYLKITII